MRLFYQIMSIAFVLYCSTILIRYPSQKIVEKHNFNWLIGKWQGNYNNSQVLENWGQSNQQLIGKGSVYSNGIETFSEEITLYQEYNNWYYCPNIHGTKIQFRIIESNKNSFTAINLKNDFPQIIGYKKTNQDTLIAFIAGDDNHSFKLEKFIYKNKNSRLQ